MTVNHFESERLLFREICEEDAELIVRWRSDPSIYRCFRKSEPLTMKKHLNWYNTQYLNNPKRVEYIIIHRESNTPIGIVGISDLKEISLEVGYLIGETTYQKQGYAVEAINAVVCCYRKIGITNFFAEIRSDNIASIKTVEKCGFEMDKEIDSDFLLYKRMCK